MKYLFYMMLMLSLSLRYGATAGSSSSSASSGSLDNVLASIHRNTQLIVQMEIGGGRKKTTKANNSQANH